MNRIRVTALGAAVSLCVCGIAFAQQKPAAKMWNEDAANAAHAVVEQGLAAVENMDVEALKAISTADIVAYDIDLESKPVRMGSLNEVVGYVQAMTTEAKKMGAKLKFENRKITCRATSELAYCLLEYDFVATLPDSTRLVQPSQTTVVLNKSESGWKWAHWHTSLSVALPAPAAETK